MAKGQLSQYNGRLTPPQIADGMNAAIRNARRLADDARTLLDLGSYPTAASLAVLSIEERGKVSILRHLAMVRDRHVPKPAEEAPANPAVDVWP